MTARSKTYRTVEEMLIFGKDCFESAEMDFLDSGNMKPFYYRNNRTSGQKNLRCFPTCSDTHSENTFCGKPLRVDLRIPR